jgi:hypothetical protein
MHCVNTPSHSQILHLFSVCRWNVKLSHACINFSCVWVGGLRLRYYNFFPIIAFHFFSTIKLIYTLVYQPWNSYFLSVFWDMNLSQTVSNHIIGIWVILGKFIHACENFTFHLQTEKRCKICEWDGVFTQCINSLKIARGNNCSKVDIPTCKLILW